MKVRLHLALAGLGFWIFGFLIGQISSRPLKREVETPAIPFLQSGIAVNSPSQPTAPPNTTTSSDPYGITEEDMKGALEMNDRRDRGEYILDLERSADQKIARKAIDDMVFQMSSNNAPALLNKFTELGLPREFASQLQTHRTKIMQASLQAELEIQQLQSARQEYEKRLRSVLNEEEYAGYVDFEKRLPAEAELENFRDVLSRQGLVLDHPSGETIKQLIGDAEAYTLVSWHGPYDGLPDPRTGDEAVIAQMREQRQTIAQTSQIVLQEAEKSGLSPEIRDLLASYYQEQIREREKTIEALKKSPSSSRPRTKLVRAATEAGQ